MEQYIYIELNIFAALITILLIVLLSRTKHGFPARGWFVATLGTVLAIIACEIVYWLVDGKTFAGARFLNIAVNFLYYVGQGAACCLFGLYCTKAAGYKLKAWGLAVYFLPFVAAFVFSAIHLGYPLFYRIDAANVYARTGGVWYAVYTVCVVVYLLYGLGLFVANTIKSLLKKTERKERNDVDRFMAFVLLIPFAGAALQIAFFGMSTIWIGGVLTLLLIYSRIQGQSAFRMERELTDRRIAAMRSQIQPHFIFNILTTIRRLCETDSQKASEAVVQFSNYLRANIDSLSNPAPVEFHKELDFIETYIGLEKIRYGERLCFKREIGPTHFYLPMLSVQPIVENAIRYGIGKKKGGGTVTLRTEETERDIIVTVEDDGVGFDENKVFEDENVHTGIENTRVRVEELCGGKFTVESKPGIGTIAKIVLPKDGIRQMMRIKKGRKR